MYQDIEIEKLREAKNNYRKNRAQACRDRFLKAAIEPKFKGSPVIQMRLAIYEIASGYYKARKPLEEFSDKAKYCRGGELYSAVAEIIDINAALYAVATACFDKQSGHILLQMAPEAGVDVLKDFVIDREWLESQSFKKKSDLEALVKELGLEVDTKLPKVKLVDAILETDLKGKVPKMIAEACKIEEPEMLCQECFESIDECVCDLEEEESAADQEEESPEVVGV